MGPKIYKRTDIRNMNNNDILNIEKELSIKQKAFDDLSDNNKGLLNEFAPNSDVGSNTFEPKAMKLFMKRLSEIKQRMTANKTSKVAKYPSMNRNSSRKSGLKRNGNGKGNRNIINIKSLIDKVFEERKFTKMINTYKNDLKNTNINKSSWKICSEIQNYIRTIFFRKSIQYLSQEI